MNLIDFNDNFQGFLEKEDILLDTGIILGLLNEKSKWHQTIKNLFDSHIFENDNVMFLYVNPTMLNEVTHLGERPILEYIRRHPTEGITKADAEIASDEMVSDIRQLIDEGIFLVLDGNKDSVLKQLEVYKDLGSADAVNASLVDTYGISLLTVDSKLAHNMKSIEAKLQNVCNVYYTSGAHTTY